MAPRPMPVRKRQTVNCTVFWLKPVASAATPNRIRQARITRRRPNRSDELPSVNAPTIMPKSGLLPMIPAATGESFQSLISCGRTDPYIARSYPSNSISIEHQHIIAMWKAFNRVSASASSIVLPFMRVSNFVE